MKNKGFTLIELLAVIIILAFIAVITTPIVFQYVKDADVASKKESAHGYVKAVDQAIGIVTIDELDRVVEGTFNIQSNGNLVNAANTSDTLEVTFKGDKPTGTVKVAGDKVVYALLKFNNRTTVKFENEEYKIQ